MVAVLESGDIPDRAGIELRASQSGQERLLTGPALAFLAGLHRRFEPLRQARLAARRQRQARYDAGALPDFRTDTAAIRAGDWKVAALPPALRDRRVEITGPVEPKLVINALNSGASCYMADFEDSTSPTWGNLLAGQQALRQAVDGTLQWRAADGRRYLPGPPGEQPVLLVRPRGWHLDEKHLLVDGVPVSASLFDIGLFAFHNAGELAARDRGPYFYLPKLECMEEAALWHDVLSFVEQSLGLPRGQVRVTVLVETLPAAFEMDEILHALRERVAGLNCGRWDYIFSCIKTLRGHAGRVLPERGQLTMAQPFLRAYSELLVRTCHRRGAHAMGGMAAQVPVRGDAAANEDALRKVREDKQREAMAGHDGTWVAHPALVPVAREVFDRCMPTPHQHHVLRDDVHVVRDDLLAVPAGSVTRGGFAANAEVCVRYLAAWLDGIGCVPIHHLMEDAATAEIARAQLWQWLHAPGLRLQDGTAVDNDLLGLVLGDLARRLDAGERLPGHGRLGEAIAMLDRLSRADELAEYLTVPAYAGLA